MRLSDALELSKKSMDSFKAEVTDLSIKELYELARDLRLVNHPEIFKICHAILKDKLIRFYKGTEALEKSATGEEGIEELRDHIYEKTGFHIDSKTSPSTTLTKIIDEITIWSP